MICLAKLDMKTVILEHFRTKTSLARAILQKNTIKKKTPEVIFNIAYPLPRAVALFVAHTK